MTQIFRINAERLRETGVEEAEKWLLNWSSHRTSYSLLGLTDEEQFALSEPRSQCYNFAALYRKDGVNFLWRGRRVPLNIRDRIGSAIHGGEIEGTLLLYKTQGNTRMNKKLFFPIRLSDNRYSIMAGSASGLQSWMRDNAGELDGDWSASYEMIYNMWATEHLVDYSLQFPADGAHLRRRARYTYLMDQHISAQDFIELCEANTNMDVPRSTYCIWKDGEILQWAQQGQDIHPKI
tara:strand:- start:4891 stop:5598 length:708 start_codon:yes stop_codon:yes gene_type:complete